MGNVLNVQDMEYAFELYDETDIIISTTSNPNNAINLDDNSNLIASVIHSGSNYIYEGTFTSWVEGNIILYDDVGYTYIENSDFTSVDLEKHFLIKPSHPLRYYINANRVTTATASGSTITIDLSTSVPFKVKINGREIDGSNFTYGATAITLLSPYEGYITGANDDIVVYTYGHDQTISSGSLTLKYLSPTTLMPLLADMQDGSYYDSNTTEICNFEGFTTSVDKSNNKINNIYQYTNFDKEVNRSSQLNMTFYKDITYSDLRPILQDKRFRLLAWDRVEETLTIFSNCIWNNGESKNYNRTKNDMNFIIDFEDEIELDYDGAYTVYGFSTYGSGTFGGLNLTATNFRT